MSSIQESIREDSLALIFSGGSGSLCGIVLGTSVANVVLPKPFEGPIVVQDDGWNSEKSWVPEELSDHGTVEISLTFEEEKVTEVYLELPSWDEPGQVLQAFQKEWGEGKQIDEYYLFLQKDGSGFELNIYPERTHIWLGTPTVEE